LEKNFDEAIIKHMESLSLYQRVKSARGQMDQTKKIAAVYKAKGDEEQAAMWIR